MKVCSVKDCNNPHDSHTYCGKHASRFRKYGNPHTKKRKNLFGKENYNYKHGMKGTRIFNIWSAMRRRCRDKNQTNYKFYGAKGIDYTERWGKFVHFYEDMKV